MYNSDIIRELEDKLYEERSANCEIMDKNALLRARAIRYRKQRDAWRRAAQQGTATDQNSVRNVS